MVIKLAPLYTLEASWGLCNRVGTSVRVRDFGMVLAFILSLGVSAGPWSTSIVIKHTVPSIPPGTAPESTVLSYSAEISHPGLGDLSPCWIVGKEGILSDSLPLFIFINKQRLLW